MSSADSDGPSGRRRFLRLLGQCGLATIGLGAAGGARAAGTRVTGLRLSAHGGRTRLVFDLDRPARYKLFTLDDPERVVIDLDDARLADRLDPVIPRDALVSAIRSGVRDGNDLRLVLDLRGTATPDSFQLGPRGPYGHRLVVDLESQAARDAGPRTVKRAADHHGEGMRELVVAIDAGHGGKDPGAVGNRGTLEKDVTLAIARKLYAMLEDEPGVRPVLVRSRDRFISLRERTRIARRNKADLFVSIHADGFHDPRARGASVYALSLRGASSEAARWLAQRENAADLKGGVKLSDKDDLVASVLLDLSQTATIQHSLEVGDHVLDNLGRHNRLHKKTVQQAGFRVLKSPDIPSILVEGAFITNPTEERKLRTARYQRAVAASIRDGMRQYFVAKAPEGTIFARRGGSHRVRPGETLSEIAQRYSVRVSDIKGANGLQGDRILPGRELVIPRLDS